MNKHQANRYPTEVAPQRLDFADAGPLPTCTNADLNDELLHLRSTLMMLHGRLRDTTVYHRTTISAVAARLAWLVASPQFLVEVDIAARRLSSRTLRWRLIAWKGGDAAIAPSYQSMLAILDALLNRLARRLPALRRLVVAGHPVGAQLAQRYSLLGDFNRITRRRMVFDSTHSMPDQKNSKPGKDAASKLRQR
jgi:hypothetical protein